MLALARRLEMANTTFRRNYPAVVAELIRPAAARHLPETAVSRYQELQQAAAQLSSDNRQLRHDLDTAAAVDREGRGMDRGGGPPWPNELVSEREGLAMFAAATTKVHMPVEQRRMDKAIAVLRAKDPALAHTSKAQLETMLTKLMDATTKTGEVSALTGRMHPEGLPASSSGGTI